jgi:hypothetical protein
MSDDGEDCEESVYFEGPCTCLDTCPNKDEPGGHGWDCCDEEDCLCEAGWTE